jgi:murein DD-endopeptidase MepM/ murein hydrolase activator NlpD
MNAGNEPYSKIIAAPFDGTIMPILYIPDWTKPENQDKSKRFEDISISEYLPIPQYDALALLDDKSLSKSSTILRYTYFTPYMWNYKLDYMEHAGGHLWVDIRAPIGTPILSIANGVVIRTVEADASGDKFIVVRHDQVPIDGVKKTLYSWYLHLSEILVREGDVVKKGDMIGRVGITGITTTPHLHLQIDTAEAPFHPYWHFSSAEARSAKLSFFEAINVGLNKDKAEKYSIHPMHFISMYLGWIWSSSVPQTPIAASVLDEPQVSKTVAAYISENEENCIGKRFSDVSEKSSFWKLLYPLLDRKCIFQESTPIFGAKQSLTFREALINTMRYFDIAPTNGTSHFSRYPTRR